MNLSEAVSISARGLNEQTDRLRARAGVTQIALTDLRAPAALANWPHVSNLREVRAARAQLTRLIGLLAAHC